MPDVRTLIADLSQRAGLDPGTDIDVSAVYGKLDGMIVTSFGTARASLEPLLVAFMLDVAEGTARSASPRAAAIRWPQSGRTIWCRWTRPPGRPR